MKYAHGVLDLETLGNTSRSPIIQIGISLPDKSGYPGGEIFNGKIEYDRSQSSVFASDKSTQKWWNKQDETTRMMVFDSHLDRVPHQSLGITFKEMNDFLERYRKDYEVDELILWSHATLDPPILINALSEFPKQLNRFRKLIHYRNFKDFRTTDFILGTVMKGFVYDMANKDVDGMSLTHHYAPDDALYEHFVLYQTLTVLRDQFDATGDIPPGS